MLALDNRFSAVGIYLLVSISRNKDQKPHKNMLTSNPPFSRHEIYSKLVWLEDLTFG